MKNFAGWVSMSFLSLALLMALITIYPFSQIWTLIYGLTVAGACFIILRFFCRKCAARNHCPHVLPGLAARWMKPVPPSPYTRFEIVITLTGTALILLFPQYWLIRNRTAFFIYWLLSGLALLLILCKLCLHCKNKNCPFYRGIDT